MEPTIVVSSNQAFLFSLGFGLAVLFLALGVYALLLRKSPLARRIESISAGGAGQPQSLVGQKLKTLIRSLLFRMAEPAKPKQEWQVSRLRKELLTAGFRTSQALNMFLGIKVCCFLLFPLLALASPLRERLTGSLLAVALVLAAGLGFLLPNLVLDNLRRKRIDKLDRELPEVLDLLVLAVEAGLGLDAALKRVSSELAISSPTLSSELAIVSLELRAGIPGNGPCATWPCAAGWRTSPAWWPCLPRPTSSGSASAVRSVSIRTRCGPKGVSGSRRRPPRFP